MKGSIEIYEINSSSSNIIFKEDNMIVDGMREHISDYFTFIIPPSAIINNAIVDPSNFSIAAISLGSSKFDLTNRNQTSAFQSLSASGNNNFLPILSQPTDITLQPSVSSNNSLGQHLNALEFYTKEIGYTHYSNTIASGLATNTGSFIPGSGITMVGTASGELAGTTIICLLNKNSVIDPQGFIYLNPCATVPATSLDQSFSGMIVSATDLSSTNELKYILSLSGNSYKFIRDYYGGIDVLGLWVYDFKSNFNTIGVPFVRLGQAHVSGSGGRYSTSLYNLDDYQKYPKFKLVAKKVLFPDGLKLNSTYDAITIIWTIRFI